MYYLCVHVKLLCIKKLFSNKKILEILWTLCHFFFFLDELWIWTTRCICGFNGHVPARVEESGRLDSANVQLNLTKLV